MKKLILAFLLLATPLPALAQNNMDEGRKHFQTGVQYYKEGDYRAALIEFKRAYEAAPNYKVLYNLGQTNLELQDYAQALGSFQKYLVDGGKEIPKDRRQQVEGEIKKLEGRVAKVVVKSNIEGADILIDDVVVGKTPTEKPILVSAGRRKIAVVKPGTGQQARTIDIAGGDEQNLDLEIAVQQQPTNPPVDTGTGNSNPPPIVVTQNPPPATQPTGSGPSTATWIGIGVTAALGAGANRHREPRAGQQEPVRRGTQSVARLLDEDRGRARQDAHLRPRHRRPRGNRDRRRGRHRDPRHHDEGLADRGREVRSIRAGADRSGRLRRLLTMRRARIAALVAIAVVPACSLLACSLLEGGEGIVPVEAGPDATMEAMATDGGGMKDATDAGADVIVDSGFDVLGLCAEECPEAGGVCTDAGTCYFDCSKNSSCDRPITCPPNIPCNVQCTGGTSCTDIDCQGSSECNINCQGSNTPCYGLIKCGGSKCTLKCNGSNACINDISCTAQICDIQCNGTNGSCPADIACSGKKCTVECNGSGSCAQGVHCTATDECTALCTGTNSPCYGKVTTTSDASAICCTGSNSCFNGASCGGSYCKIDCKGTNGPCFGGTTCTATTCVDASVCP